LMSIAIPKCNPNLSARKSLRGCFEREAEARICHDYPDAGRASASDNQWRAGQDDQFPSYLYITGRRPYVFT
ncbi:TPA: hypothetical protein ACHT65_004867, partial [Klebsiella pneumoniae]